MIFSKLIFNTRVYGGLFIGLRSKVSSHVMYTVNSAEGYLKMVCITIENKIDHKYEHKMDKNKVLICFDTS